MELLNGADVVLATTTGATLDGPLRFRGANTHSDILVITQHTLMISYSDIFVNPQCAFASGLYNSPVCLTVSLSVCHTLIGDHSYLVKVTPVSRF